MKVIALYRSQSEHGSRVEQYSRDFLRLHNLQLELVDIDTVEGARAAELYDVVRYPTFVALKDDGSLLQSWEGDELPLMNDLAYYLAQ